MSIHILGLRPYKDQHGEWRKREAFFENKWRSPSVSDLFNNLPHYMEAIDEDQRWNLYYTAASVADDKKGRLFYEQDIIPFDVDGIDHTRLSEYAPLVIKAIGADPSKTAVIMSGNGIQVIVQTQEVMTYEEVFDELRPFYKVLCAKIDEALNHALLDGGADPSVWSPARLLRLPDTENRKDDKPNTKAYFIESNLEPQEYDLIEKSGIPVLQAGDDYISDRLMSKFPDPDPLAVQAGCEFLKWCKENPNSVAEPQWYAMLSILARLPDGDTLCHEYSQEYDKYNEYTTNVKIDQARTSSGPRTCNNINTIWDGCGSCANWGKCKSPIQLVGEEHIATRLTGFYKISVRDNGTEVRIPDYDGLVKFFEQQHPFVTHLHGKMTYTYNDGVWKDIPIAAIEGFAEKSFDPSPTNSIVAEFKGKIQRRNQKDQEWFEDTHSVVNFSNGVLDLRTRELVAHDKKFPFQYKLPFEYDPSAKCPRFDQYLEEVTLGDEHLSNILLEFMGYTLAGISPEIGQKALILTGDGSNGKSVLLDLLKYMAGDGNYSSLYMGYELAKMENRYQLDGKLFNVSEEVPSKAFSDVSLFKSLVTGGEVQARKLYCDSYSMKTKAKIIMACNDLPNTTDTSHGIMRRLLIIPFRRKFTEANRDVRLREKLYEEASGIFNRTLEGLDRFLASGQFSDSSAANDALKEYQEENDPILLWFRENFVPTSDDVFYKVSDIYLEYKYKMEEIMEKPVSMVKLGKRMKQLIGDDWGAFKRINGTPFRALTNYQKISTQKEKEDF